MLVLVLHNTVGGSFKYECGSSSSACWACPPLQRAGRLACSRTSCWRPGPLSRSSLGYRPPPGVRARSDRRDSAPGPPGLVPLAGRGALCCIVSDRGPLAGQAPLDAGGRSYEWLCRFGFVPRRARAALWIFQREPRGRQGGSHRWGHRRLRGGRLRYLSTALDGTSSTRFCRFVPQLGPLQQLGPDYQLGLDLLLWLPWQRGFLSERDVGVGRASARAGPPRGRGPRSNRLLRRGAYPRGGPWPSVGSRSYVVAPSAELASRRALAAAPPSVERRRPALAPGVGKGGAARERGPVPVPHRPTPRFFPR